MKMGVWRLRLAINKSYVMNREVLDLSEAHNASTILSSYSVIRRPADITMRG